MSRRPPLGTELARERLQAAPRMFRHPLPSARTCPPPPTPVGLCPGVHSLWASPGPRRVPCDPRSVCVGMCQRGWFPHNFFFHLTTLQNWRCHIKTRISSFFWEVNSSGHLGLLLLWPCSAGVVFCTPLSPPGPPHSSLGLPSPPGAFSHAGPRLTSERPRLPLSHHLARSPLPIPGPAARGALRQSQND